MGDIESVNHTLLGELLGAGVTPVFCAIMHDGQGTLLNCNADSVASSVALGAARIAPTELVFCFEKSGVLRDPEDETTLIREIAAVLGATDTVTSPTFAIVNQYKGANNRRIYHFDFYRIKKLEEVYDMGYEDYLYSGALCFIEWPELIEELLPGNTVKVTIEEIENGERKVTLEQLD